MQNQPAKKIPIQARSKELRLRAAGGIQVASSFEKCDRTAVTLIGLATLPLLGGFATEWSVFFLFGATLVGVAGLFLFLPVALNFGRSFHPLRLLAASTTAAYGLGATVSWLFAQSGLVGGFDIVLEEFGIRVSDISLALIAAGIFSVILMSVVWGRETSGAELSLSRQLSQVVSSPLSGRFLQFIATVVAAFEAVYMLNGSVGYKTFATSEVLEADIVLVVTAAQASPFLCGILLARWRNGLAEKSAKLVLGFVFAVCLIWFVTRGRGPLLVACITGLLGFSAVRPIDLRRLLSFILLVLLPVMITASMLAQTIRFFQMVDETTRENVFSALNVAGREMLRFSGDEKRDAQESQVSNLASRPLYANYPAQLIRLWRENGVKVLGFEEILNAVRISIPRMIYPNKQGVPLNETLYMLRLGMSGFDNAENVLMCSLVSFAFVGPLVWPILAWVFFRLAVVAMRRSSSIICTLIGTAWVVSLTLGGGEGDLPAFFVALRNVALLAVFAIPCEVFLKRTFPIPPLDGFVRMPPRQAGSRNARSVGARSLPGDTSP